MSSISLADIVVMAEADPKKAQRHGNECVLRDSKGAPFKLCDSTPRDLGIGGIGIEMYFVFLKQMVILFSVMTLISIPIVAINYMGGYLYAVEKTSPFEASTIANQKGITTHTTNQTVAEDEIRQQKKYMYTTIMLDIIYCTAYIGMIIIFNCYNKSRVNDRHNLTVADFSVMIDIASGEEVKEEELKPFFERYGAVHECVVPKYYGSKLKKYIDYAQAEKTLKGNQKKPAFRESTEELVQLKTKRDEALKSAKEYRDHGKDLTKAFVIFDTLVSREQCLMEYSGWRSKAKLRSQPQTLKFQGRPVIVRKAPEPGEINWENFGVHHKNWKFALIYLVVAVTLLVSLFIVSVVEYYENRLPIYSTCLEFYELRHYNSTSNSTVFTKDMTVQEIICYCGGYKETDVEDDPNYSSFCSKYMKEFFKIWAIRITGISAIALVNMIIKYAIMGFAKLESFATNTKEELSKLTMLVITQTLNTPLVILIANMNFDGVDFVTYFHNNFPGGKYFFSGLHPNFTRFWYVKVGMSILVLKAVGVIWPQILSIAFMVPVCALKRFFFAHKEVFQTDMNKCYEKLNINLWDRYASVLTNTIYTLMFCSGIPFLLPLQAVTHVVQYWIDKALFVRFSRRPPPYGKQLNSKTYRLMPLAMCAHMLCAIFVYTCSQIYPLTVESVTDSEGVTLYQGEEVSLIDRITSKRGLPFLVGAVLILCFVAFKPVVGHIVSIICPRFAHQPHKYVQSNNSFSILKPVMKKNHIVTYDISGNPQYAYVIDQISAHTKAQPLS